MTAKRSLNIIDVKSPCEEEWLDMNEVSPGRRHCDLCMQDVYDLSTMTRDAAEALVFESTGRVCVRFFRRVDGTIVTSDCTPVRMRRLREAGRGALRVGARIAGGLVALLAALGIARLAGVDVAGWFGGGAVMGDIAMPMGEVAYHEDPSVEAPVLRLTETTEAPATTEEPAAPQ